jgi:GT2 family glycosyltransferase
LWYPENQGLQHGGVIIGIGGVAGHAHLRLAKGQVGYFGRAALHHRLQAVTAACLLIRKSHFWAVGGLDTQLAVAFNDVDFCLRLHQAGLACIYTPYAEMVHHESASRGDDLTGARRERFMSETRFMVDRWGDSLQQDPFFSPNLSLDHSDFRPAQVSRVPDWLSTTPGTQ